jgi:hypothetical protein
MEGGGYVVTGGRIGVSPTAEFWDYSEGTAEVAELCVVKTVIVAPEIKFGVWGGYGSRSIERVVGGGQ